MIGYIAYSKDYKPKKPRISHQCIEASRFRGYRRYLFSSRCVAAFQSPELAQIMAICNSAWCSGWTFPCQIMKVSYETDDIDHDIEGGHDLNNATLIGHVPWKRISHGTFLRFCALGIASFRKHNFKSWDEVMKTVIEVESQRQHEQLAFYPRGCDPKEERDGLINNGLKFDELIKKVDDQPIYNFPYGGLLAYSFNEHFCDHSIDLAGVLVIAKMNPRSGQVITWRQV